MISRYRARVPGPAPIAYQLGDQRVLCTPECLPDKRAQEMADAGEHVGDVQPWTVELWPGDEHLCCDGCGSVLVKAPEPGGEDEEDERPT